MSVIAPPAARRPAARHRRSPWRNALDAVSRVGTAVTLAALVVVGGAVGGLFDEAPAASDATMTVTFGHH